MIKCNLKGLKVGRLLVLEETDKRIFRKVVWKCLCDCGNIVEVRSSNLSTGGTKSCGCLNREPRMTNLKHGHRRTKKVTATYISWANMLNRCSSPNSPEFHRYGGRGITVCERWNDFRNFLEDMGIRPEGLTIDRIDNDRGYEPENCRWVTHKENNRNGIGTKLTIKKVKRIKQLLRDTKRSCAEIAKLYEISDSSIYHIKAGSHWGDVKI